MVDGTIRFPSHPKIASELLESVLRNKNILMYGANSKLPSVGHITEYKLEFEEIGVSTARVELSYDILNFSNTNNTQTKKLDLLILTTSYDENWSYRMINKVWNGTYPSTVAVDENTGVIYLVWLKERSLELTYFNKLSDSELEAFSISLESKFPYRIIIDPDAMFKYIDGGEGLNHLRKNVCIDFNCAIPIIVKMVGGDVTDEVE